MLERETNVFTILNPHELTAAYRLYRLRGLRSDQEEYYRNREVVASKLSYMLKVPVVVVERDGEPYAVVRDDAPALPAAMPLVRQAVRFELEGSTLQLNFTLRSPENDLICLKFLQFALQAPLFKRLDLWQPKSGRPFYEKRGKITKGVMHHRGFAVRAVVSADGELGLCIDFASKHVESTPLPSRLDTNAFNRLQGRTLVYRYGHSWYEITPLSVADSDVTEFLIPVGGELVSLHRFLLDHARHPVPPELRDLREDASVLYYKNNTGGDRAAPTSLCYPVLGTDDRRVASLREQTAPLPSVRRSQIQHVFATYFRQLEVGNVVLKLDSKPVRAPDRTFAFPDLEFGRGQRLTIRGTPCARSTNLPALGRDRSALLRAPEAGPYDASPLYRVYYVFPRSVVDSYGPALKMGLDEVVNEFVTDGNFDPMIVPYNDLLPKSYPHQGRAILEAIETKCLEPGYLVVMIHTIVGRKLREEDQLANMVTRKLYDHDYRASVIHVDSSKDLYAMVTDGGTPRYVPHEPKRGQLRGYLRGVAINKILLPQGKTPFILASPLHADVTIGLDVKNNTAGLIAVDRFGGNVHTELHTSRRKEQLSEDQLHKYLVDIVRSIAADLAYPPKTLVLHRDGRTFASEQLGATNALHTLKVEGVLDPEASLTIIDISKSSPVPFRLFDVRSGSRGAVARNPELGAYYLVDEHDGYVCTTGEPQLRSGTARPLHVHKVSGPLLLQECLEDIYFLSCLSWTRPEGSMRDPVTIRLLDHRLGERAGDFDEGALEYEGFFEEVMHE